MLLPDLGDLQPTRDWNELLAHSTRRGRLLRRRRRLLQISPAIVLGISMLVATPALLDVSHNETLEQTPVHDGQPATQPTPTVGLGYAPTTETQASDAGGTTTATGTARSDRLRRPTVDAPRPAAAAPVAAPVASTAAAQWRRIVVQYADATGDASGTQGAGAPAGAPGTDPTSDPAMDIIRMRFRTTDSGVEVTMWLAGTFRSDAQYWAYLTDRRTGCKLELAVGGGYRDTLYAVCADGTRNVPIPDTTDASYSELTARIPYAALSTTDTYDHLNGESRLTHPAEGSFPFDEATTNAVFGPIKAGRR